MIHCRLLPHYLYQLILSPMNPVKSAADRSLLCHLRPASASDFPCLPYKNNYVSNLGACLDNLDLSGKATVTTIGGTKKNSPTNKLQTSQFRRVPGRARSGIGIDHTAWRSAGPPENNRLIKSHYSNKLFYSPGNNKKTHTFRSLCAELQMETPAVCKHKLWSTSDKASSREPYPSRRRCRHRAISQLKHKIVYFFLQWPLLCVGPKRCDGFPLGSFLSSLYSTIFSRDRE